ncbi:hypothetical protein [Frankia gtarii]|uniref:hypothetical protein n=1 Tax=Frankia gtarii TaxID=2950102 RepID=UPI0021C02F84|nr:hypothetical protein [Frankia gtarii]
MAFAQANSVYGQIRLDATPASTKSLGYDPAGRLTSVADTVSYGGSASCTTRVYGYDADSNRLSLTSYPDGGGSDTGACSTSTSATGYSFGYDQADRLTNSGYTYDLFGQTTTDPYPPAGSSASLGYYVNDLVASETVDSSTRSYALDPGRRVRSWSDGSTTSVNHMFDLDGKCIQIWHKNCRDKKIIWRRRGRFSKAAYAHTEIGFSGCLDVCWGISAQGLGATGGALNRWWRQGCCSLGLNYGYSP